MGKDFDYDERSPTPSQRSPVYQPEVGDHVKVLGTKEQQGEPVENKSYSFKKEEKTEDRDDTNLKIKIEDMKMEDDEFDLRMLDNTEGEEEEKVMKNMNRRILGDLVSER